MIVVENLSKSFKTRKATLAVLDKVSFTAYDGEVFGLLGPNGAGKTTALRTIATLLRPDGGTVAVDHYDSIRDSRSVRDSLGFLTSEMQLTGHLSGREMLQFFWSTKPYAKRGDCGSHRAVGSYFLHGNISR